MIILNKKLKQFKYTYFMYKHIMEHLIQTDKSYFVVVNVELDDLLQRCVDEINGKLDVKPSLILYGKIVYQQRNVGFFSNTSVGYYYTNKLQASKQMTPALNELLHFVNNKLNADFNGILVNEYQDGNNYIGKHSDDEKGLSNIGVVCISFGASRKFRIRNKETNKIVMDIPTTSKQLWIMGGQFQQEFTHEIPIEKRVKDSRVSFTFRKHVV